MGACTPRARLAPVAVTATIPVAPTPIPRAAATPRAAARAFSAAFVSGRVRVAEGYLTPGLRARVAVTPLAVDLGIEGPPRSYRLSAHRPFAGQDVVTARYTYDGGSSIVRLLLTRVGRGWQIAAISRVRQAA